jgi:hypothetical protein
MRVGNQAEQSVEEFERRGNVHGKSAHIQHVLQGIMRLANSAQAT